MYNNAWYLLLSSLPVSIYFGIQGTKNKQNMVKYLFRNAFYTTLATGTLVYTVFNLAKKENEYSNRYLSQYSLAQLRSMAVGNPLPAYTSNYIPQNQ